MTADPPRYVDEEQLRGALTCAEAADAVEAALLEGLDPEVEAPRSSIPAGPGKLMTMPAAVGAHATVKLVAIGGEPRIQGLCVVFDTGTLSPVALFDGVALTNLRTSAVSLLAARHLAPGDARRLVVFGAGPQARAHAEAFGVAFDLEEISVLARDASRRRVRDLVGRADIVCCATTARDPLFDGGLVSDDALVVAVGSHEPDAREVDERLVRRATVVVESRGSALREAGDVIAAGVPVEDLVTLSELVGGREVRRDRPRLFKSTGMSWEDTVVVSAALEAI